MRPGRGLPRLVAMAASLLLLGAPGGAVRGQEPTPEGEVAAQQAASLEAAARRVAAAWSVGEPSLLDDLVRPEGVAYHAGNHEHPALAKRQLMATLSDLMGDGQARGVAMGRISRVEGSRPRGFVELAWSAVPKGTTEVVRSTIFVSFEHAQGRWWIAEIRVLR